tara:strand:- start:54683 stop:55489 length:807 start_codon:yes stop_codon:yes gene_type:complete
MLINKYEPAIIPTGSQLNEGQITVTLSSTRYSAVLAVFPNEYYIVINPTSIEVHPKMEWVPDTTIQVTIPTGTHEFSTPDDFYYYAPEHVMYTKGFLNTDTVWDKLEQEGLSTPLEKELLSNLSTNLKEYGHKLSKSLVGSFRYNNTPEDVNLTLLKGFRRAQQLAIMLGLDSLVELILFSPSGSPQWFRKTHIPFCLEDKVVLEKINELKVETAKLYARLISAGANVSYVEALSTHLSSESKLYELAQALITYFLALRYHQNGEFSY